MTPEQNFRILLIEDNPHNAELFCEMIRQAPRAQFTVAHRARTLAEALKVVAEDPVDLALLDLGLPDSDGIGTFLKLRAQAPCLPVIVLSGMDDEETALQIVRKGAQDYLVKGTFDMHLLARAMRYAIERARVEASLRQASENLFVAEDDLKEAHEELRSVRLQLIEAEKMKSIGRLAAGVAHEVKNPLAIIEMGIAYLSQQKFSDDSNVPMILSDISEAVKRADAVIWGLLDFSAPKQLEVCEEDLNAVISHSLLLVRGEMNGSVPFRVVKELEPDLPPLKLDRLKIGQVFVNVFMNAIHAMPQGGTLVVRTYAKQLAGAGKNLDDSRPEIFPVESTLVVAEIDDEGTGVPEDKLSKVFDPFFTTKPKGKGTGLGLSVTRSIIDLHGGTIEIFNRPAGGARVKIMFEV